MEQAFYTLQDFMVHTKAVIYVLMGLWLVGVVGFWRFLTGRDDDSYAFAARETHLLRQHLVDVRRKKCMNL